MPDVDEIIDGLRRRGLPVWAPSARLGVGAEPSLDGEIVVPLADAKAAVRAAVDARTAEIVKMLRPRTNDGADIVAIGWESMRQAAADGFRDATAFYDAIEAMTDEVARRFPDGGTNDG